MTERKNIPCDLHLEHLNRCLKTSAKYVGVIHHISSKFEQQTTNIGIERSILAIPSSSKDFQTLFAELDKLKVFDVFHKRTIAVSNIWIGWLIAFTEQWSIYHIY